MNKYIEFVKNYESYDKFILFLLSLGFNEAETAEMCETTRQTVYNVIKRNKGIYREFIRQAPSEEQPV